MRTSRFLLLAALLLLPSAALIATRRVEAPTPPVPWPSPAGPAGPAMGVPPAPAVEPRSPAKGGVLPGAGAQGDRPSDADGAASAAAAEALREWGGLDSPRVRLTYDLAALAEWGVLGLPASPDLDPSTGTAPAVEAGRPVEMDAEAFVAAGGIAAAPVVELVGKRRPELEEGVAVSLTGRVVEAEGGAPVAGARLVVTSTFYVRRYFYDHHLREVARAVTAADGSYRIDRLNVDPAHFGRGGRLYLSVTAEAHAPALAVELATVTPGVANRVKDVALACAAGTLRGRVLDYWEGKAVSGARVYATGAIDPITYPKDERPALFVGAPTTVTDADGRFLLEGVGTGIQTVSVHGGDDCVGRGACVVPFTGEFEVRTRAIRGRIEGTTVDGNGDPVALVTVEGGDNTTHSFADGRFVLENFRGDAPTVSFTHPDFAPAVLEAVRDGTAGLLVRMERPRIAVVLEVKDRDTGEPVERVRIGFEFPAGAGSVAPTSPHRLALDGRYCVRLPEGARGLTVEADGRRGAEVPLAGRADGEVVPVLLAPAGG